MIDSHLHCDFTEGKKEQQLQLLKKMMLERNITKAVLYLISDRDYEKENYLLDFGTNIIPAMMLDPKDDRVDQKLKKLKKSGIKMLKLLPYEQQLLYEDYDRVCDYALKAQEQDMILTICGAYGSKDVYRTNGVELAAHILDAGFKNPLIIAHGGMVRLLDTHSLMCEYPNLFIDISFTIPYWWGSHVIEDLNFVIQRAEFEHVFWGSDYPNHSFDDALYYFDLFCKKFQITPQNRDKLLSANFEKFYEEYLK